MKLLSIGGTRPQFVKMAVLSKSIEEYNRFNANAIEHRILHTGQHRDAEMSDIFFRELGIPTPKLLEMASTRAPGLQTAIMLAGIEAELNDWRPDAVIAYGDTNSTIASALAAAKLHVPIIHLEAGLRSFNRVMQEEINRIVTDHISDLLLCPTHAAVDQLQVEGLGNRAVFVGDVMLDAVEMFGRHESSSKTLQTLPVKAGEYALITVHRAESTDSPARLAGVLDAIRELDLPVIFPMHPRLRKHLLTTNSGGLFLGDHVHIVEPVGYLEMLSLQRNARFIMTDSGGLQKEAYFIGVPCITLREETEWRETLHGGWNTLAGSDTSKILLAAADLSSNGKSVVRESRNLIGFGEGQAGKRSVEQIIEMVRAA